MSKDKYKVRNWKQYNEGLKQRGAITVWMHKEVLEKWNYQGKKKKGGQFTYSDLAIEVCLTVRKVYHLGYRQTQGFVENFFAQIKAPLPVPCYTQMCRRSACLSISLKRGKGKTITDIVVDSTGLKVYGEGEWKVKKHGAGKHRTWMKLHIALDAEEQEVQAVALTSNTVDDGEEAEELLSQIEVPIHSFTADGAYDQTKVRKALHQKSQEQQQDILQVIAPRHTAVVDKKGKEYLRQRNDDLVMIATMGRKQWKVMSGYHQRSKAETFMYRYKVILGGQLQARKFHQQQTEVRVGCKILNQMLSLAKPISEKVA